MDGGASLALILAAVTYGPLVAYPLIAAPVLAIGILCILIQMGTAALCARNGWTCPRWATFHDVPEF
jgi:hypothetical protein